MRVFTEDTELFLNDYNARYLNFTYTPAEYEVKSFWADKALSPLYFESAQKYDTLKIQLMFKQATLDDISALSEQLKQCSIQLENAFTANRIFECILKASQLQKVSQKVYTITYTFDCIVYGDTHVETLSAQSAFLFIQGAKETEAVITTQNKTDSVIAMAGITGFTVRNLAVGEKIIIDGERKLVTSNGVNAFDRVEFLSFPRFKAGSNDISVTGAAEVTIKYRERW